MANTLADVQATFLLLDSRFSMLLAAAESPYQADALKKQYEMARQNYDATASAVLADDDSQVAALSHQLKAANSQVMQVTSNIGDFDEVIGRIANAVNLSSRLVAMAGPGPGH